MNQSFSFFDERAREAAKEARAAKLDNVRDRALRSEAAWREMANRAKSMEKDRAQAAAKVMTLRESAVADATTS